jgi:hypothetical protein
MKRPLTLILAAILMLILALVVGGFAAARQFGLLNTLSLGGMRPIVGAERLPRDSADLPRGFEPGEGETFVLPEGVDPSDLSRGVTPGGATRVRGVESLGILGGVWNWAAIGLGGLGLLAAFLLFKPSRWGIILAVILSLLILLVSAPTLLSLPLLLVRSSALLNFGPVVLLTFGPALLQIFLALAVLVLVLLPSSRAAVARQPATVVEGAEEEPQERVVR